MADLLADYATAADGFAAVLAGCSEADLAASSACAGWTGGDVVDHVCGLASQFTASFGGSVPTVPEGATPSERYAALRGALVAAISAPGAMEQMVTSPLGRELPAGVLFGINATDTLLHTWDLAQAAGVPAGLDAELLERSWQNIVPMDDDIRQPGFFGPKVAVGEDAPRDVQALAFFGRDARS